ncbi:MAG: hypothetical protein ACUVWN_13075 [bacterium]
MNGVIEFLRGEFKKLRPFKAPLQEWNIPSAGADIPLQEWNLLERILRHSNIQKQIEEWQELGIVDENFKVEDVFENSTSLKEWQVFPSERGVDAEGGRDS